MNWKRIFSRKISVLPVWKESNEAAFATRGINTSHPYVGLRALHRLALHIRLLD